MHWIDPDCLPETAGVVDRFLQNADGEADGLVLTGGTEVHFPPHMGPHVWREIRPGSAVRIRGVRPRGVAMIAAVAVQPEDGPWIVDGGPPEHDDARKAARKRAAEARTPTEIEGVLRHVLHGPKGEIRGLLLEDGRSGRFPPQAAQALAALLRPGTHLVLRGEAFSGQYGTVVAVREIGTAADNLCRIDPKSTKAKNDKGRQQGAPELAAARPA